MTNRAHRRTEQVGRNDGYVAIIAIPPALMARSYRPRSRAHCHTALSSSASPASPFLLLRRSHAISWTSEVIVSPGSLERPRSGATDTRNEQTLHLCKPLIAQSTAGDGRRL